MSHDRNMTDEQMAAIVSDPTTFADALRDNDFTNDYYNRLTACHRRDIAAEDRVRRLRNRTSPTCLIIGHRPNPVTETTVDVLRGTETTRVGQECSCCGRYTLLSVTGSAPRTRGAYART